MITTSFNRGALAQALFLFGILGLGCRGQGNTPEKPQGSAAQAPSQAAPPSAGSSKSAAAMASGATSPTGSSSAGSSSSASPVTSAAPPSSAPGAVDAKRYPWLSGSTREMPVPTESLATRIPVPPGCARIDLPAGSFSSWLRDLPVAAPNTPVRSAKGTELYPGDDEYVAAVVAIDAGKGDLQRGPELIVRLQAEWQFSQGSREVTFLAATKDPLPYSKWSQGLRALTQGPHLYWVKKTKPNDPNDHAQFLDYLSIVFMWSNSSALRMQSEPVPAENLTPGDFFLSSDKGANTVLVVDVAQKKNGERLALLAETHSTASNMYILRPGRGTPWFSIRPPASLLTPHAPEFGWKDLRRFRAPSASK